MPPLWPGGLTPARPKSRDEALQHHLSSSPPKRPSLPNPDPSLNPWYSSAKAEVGYTSCRHAPYRVIKQAFVDSSVHKPKSEVR